MIHLQVEYCKTCFNAIMAIFSFMKNLSMRMQNGELTSRNISRLVGITAVLAQCHVALQKVGRCSVHGKK